tara:strand:+ start:99 stop:317 length:219 start_codon:yes stop_codon:yes gene_type:complete
MIVNRVSPESFTGDIYAKAYDKPYRHFKDLSLAELHTIDVFIECVGKYGVIAMEDKLNLILDNPAMFDNPSR